jgi:hypothetical protein
MTQRDRRYKVNQQIVDSMRDMRKRGFTYKSIGEAHNVSTFTANYWTNERTRSKQRAKVAKRRYAQGDKERVARDQRKRKENFEQNPQAKLRHTIQSALDEKRVKRKTVKGMSMKNARKVISSKKLNTPNSKIDGD